MVIPDTFATHNADKQWGTVYVEKPVLELPYTTASNSNPEKIKIFGVVEEPRSATWIYMTMTEPSGKTYQTKNVVTRDGYYENFILICCNKIGTYSVYVEWRGYHIGTVTFNVIQKSTTQNPTVSTATSKTSTLLTLNPLPSTFEIKDQNSPGVGITFSGKLTTSDRQYVITGAKIQLEDIRSGQTVQVTTDDNGEFSIKLNRAAGSNYAINAVFDGSLNFESSKSQTEYFDVRQVSFPPQISPPQPPPQISPPQTSPPLEVTNWGAMIFWIVIIMVIVIMVVRKIVKRKKRIPVIIQTSSSGRGFEEGPESTIVFTKPAKVLPKPANVLPKPAKVLPKPVNVLPKKKKSHVNKSSSRFECKCGSHTCKKFYKTEKERKLHLLYALPSRSSTKYKQSVKKAKNKKDLEAWYEQMNFLATEYKDDTANSVSRVRKKRSYVPKASEAEKQWIKDHEMTDSELKQYIKDTKDTQKYDDDGNLRSEAKKLYVRDNQDINKLLEKEPEIIQTISREMVTEYLNYKRTIDKSRKIKLIDEYLIHKSVAKVIELHSATGSTRREGEIKRHLITGLRLPAELRKLEEEGGLHPNHECSIKIALFATDHFNWDGQKNKEKDVVNLALAISEYLQSDLELNQIFQEEKRSEEVITRSKKRDEIHEKYEVEYSSSWQRVDRTLPQYLKLHGSKNLEVVEFLCKWEFKHKNRLPFRIADALLDNPEEALEKYKDELL